MAKTKTARRPRGRETYTTPPKPAPEFPGCKAVHLPRKDLESFDRRLEYWDGRTETAMICDPASPYHEQRSRLLNALIERIAQVRGAPIKNFGSMDLREQDAPQSIMQADESVYLHPDRSRMPGPSAMVIGVDDHPDVVLEGGNAKNGKYGLTKNQHSCRLDLAIRRRAEVALEVPVEQRQTRA